MPGLYSTISGLSSAFLLLEYSTKAISILPTLFVTKVPLEVPHDCGTALLITGMCFKAPFFKKRRSPLDPESSRTLIVLLLTISSLLTLLSCLTVRFRRDLAIFCLGFDLVLVHFILAILNILARNSHCRYYCSNFTRILANYCIFATPRYVCIVEG